jgi:DNA-binding response OmpR family regulator
MLPAEPTRAVSGEAVSPLPHQEGDDVSRSEPAAGGIVALFNASDDTVDMVQKLLTDAGHGQRLIWCHFADLKKGFVDFAGFMGKHNPDVVIFDISPPYDENWKFFKTMRDSRTMKGRGLILTTTNKHQLDQIAGEDSYAVEVVGKPKDIREIDVAIKLATRKAGKKQAYVRARTRRAQSEAADQKH